MTQLHHALLFLVSLLLFCRPTSQQFHHPQRISPNDLAALRDIKNSLTDLSSRPGTNFFSTWDFSAPDPCSSFAGVTCSVQPGSVSGQRVTTLTLGTGLSDSPGLSGSLSPSISNLTELTQLILFSGIVTGPIPSQLDSLKNLRVVSLTKNRLTGAIPETLLTLPNLHTLDLSCNQLAGPVADLSGLTQLRVLVLASNRLYGDLPELPAQLLHLDLKNNGLSGTLPNRMPLTLRYLSASMNSMWGPLNGLESLSELVYLDLSMNRFSGTIPPSLFRPSLSSMLLQRNNLSGGVPPSLLPNPSSPPSISISLYGSGSIVDLSHNFLTGEISSVLAGVETLFLNNNHLVGTVPEEYVNSVYSGSTKTLYLQHNYITRFPLESGSVLPESASVCLAYNCMVPRVGLTACPASAGGQLSRPPHQCSVFNNGSSIG
ncbi:hypothetical protein RJ639_031661 [Escallonia herrerae]|uniref:Leucine-rich repeat-containing N-terminal plant-type domain-containing protein n=1 Tax=Escallonia herrerae TaxID=1293975 RepID=A0AA88WYX3_9ASTE|nr:hypothetical protein RJ639_031661 [Escallonia herrerae]